MELVQIKLQTREGEHVATVEMLPFVKPPDVALWGERYFIRSADDANVFRECFCAPLLNVRHAPGPDGKIPAFAPAIDPA